MDVIDTFGVETVIVNVQADARETDAEEGLVCTEWTVDSIGVELGAVFSDGDELSTSKVCRFGLSLPGLTKVLKCLLPPR